MLLIVASCTEKDTYECSCDYDKYQDSIEVFENRTEDDIASDCAAREEELKKEYGQAECTFALRLE